MNTARHGAIGLSAVVAVWAALGFAQDAALPRERLFPEKIAPLFQKHCISCHNPDKARGGLNMSSRASLLAGGDNGPVILAGNSKQSRLHQMIAGPMPKMPRQAEPLSADDVAQIGRWIDLGAPWPDGVTIAKKKSDTQEIWWSLRPLVKPTLPQVKDAAWCKTPIDHFILAMLEAKGMKPSAAADPFNYLRRVKYDLHGLPPTAQEMVN